MAPMGWFQSQHVLPWRRLGTSALVLAGAAWVWRCHSCEKPVTSLPISGTDGVEAAAFFSPPEVPLEPPIALPLAAACRIDAPLPSEPLPIPLPPLPEEPVGQERAPANGSKANRPALMPPQPMPPQAFTEWVERPVDMNIVPPARSTSEVAKPPGKAATPQPVTEKRAEQSRPTQIVDLLDDPLIDDHSTAADAQALLADNSAIVTGSPTGAMVIEHAQAKIRHGFALGQRGANFAARAEFIDVLRMIAEAKDQKHGASRRTTALANGLRALDEAGDFAPRGAEPESGVRLAVILQSHRTPIAKEAGAGKLLPAQLTDKYFHYAQLQLGASVAGEPAGSMALHALGKLYSQLERVEADKHPLADRKAFALQKAALLAREDNHLAAHELGVLMAESGHYAESEYVLNQVAMREPHPVVFRNLARVQRKLGLTQLADASEWQAQALAARDANSSGNVMWVAPNDLARTGDPLAPAAAKNKLAAQSPPLPVKPTAAAPMREPVQNVTRLPGGYLR
jgi:hypothetical protein